MIELQEWKLSPKSSLRALIIINMKLGSKPWRTPYLHVWECHKPFWAGLRSSNSWRRCPEGCIVLELCHTLAHPLPRFANLSHPPFTSWPCMHSLDRWSWANFQLTRLNIEGACRGHMAVGQDSRRARIDPILQTTVLGSTSSKNTTTAAKRTQR
jgi:hypothetical protein